MYYIYMYTVHECYTNANFPSLFSSTSTEKPMPIDCIATYSKGFMCSGGSGTLHLFEKTDDRNIYKKARSVSIWVDPSFSLVPQDANEEGSTLSNEILSMTLSPSEENVVCSTNMQQLYNLTLSAADLQGKVHAFTCIIHVPQVPSTSI